MTGSLREFAARSGSERALLCVAAAVLVSGRALLWLVGLDRARRALDLFAAVSTALAPVEDPRRIPWAVRSAAAALPGTYDCLPRAIAVEALMANHGFRATVRLGVAKGDAEFRAHAWVEREGTVVVGDLDDLERFRPLAEWSTDR